MPPIWLQIVKGYQERLRYGPTVPFVFGACRDPIGSTPSSRAAGQVELLGFLRMMREEMPSDYGVNIQECPEIDALILARGGNGSLTWGDIPAAHLDALSAKLWNRYGDHIAKGRYSKAGSKGWRVFSETEKTTIEELRRG